MADDDDEDSFGEFTFATNSSSHITTTTTAAEDDDWGDFNSFQTNTTTTTKDHNIKSPPPPDTEPKWEKFKGALPLSLFGGDDDDVDVEENHDHKSVTPVAGNDINNDKRNVKLGINDLISNLYGPRQQQQQEISRVVDNGNELDPVSDSLSSFSLNGVAAGNHGSDDDEGGWEFINAFSDNKERFEKTMSPVVGSNGSIDLFAASNNGAFVESHVRDNGFDSKAFGNFQNGFTADLKDKFKGPANELSSNPAVEEAESDDFDDTFGEFETAFMEQPATKKELSAERFDPLGSHDSNLFAFPNGVPSGSHKGNNGFDFSQISVVQNGVTSDPFSQTEWKETKNDSDSLSRGGSANDESFGKFETTFPASGLKREGSEARSKNYKEPVPLSIFGIEEDSEADTSLKLEHEMFKSSTLKNNLRSQSSNLSINDILSDLYSQAQPISSNGKEDSPHSTGRESLSHIVDDDDDDDDDNFDDGSWEFKDASIQSRVENQNTSDGSWEFKDASIQSSIENQNMSDGSREFKDASIQSRVENQNTSDGSWEFKDASIQSSVGNQNTSDGSWEFKDASIQSSVGNQNMSDGSWEFKDASIQSRVENQNISDGSWEFKDASIQSRVENPNMSDGSWETKDASSHSRVENPNMSFEKKLNSCVDFYSNLKDDLAVVARSHLHGLKKAESTAALAGEEMKAAALNKEIQEALVELYQKDIVLTESGLDDHSDQAISLKQYSETLREPHFQLLESEYHISRRLSLAESDLRTTVDLINHSATVLKILSLAPKGEPADYVSIWLKVISVCSQELKHGAWIWKQSLEKNVHRELLSEQKGKLFILALGEIYRAVVILGAAVNFYKPWILLSGAVLEGIYALLEECHSLWSTSGLEEAIPAESFSEAIRHIRNLDEFAISKEVLSREESQCGLSLLSPRVVPDMKMVIWNGDNYFVSLANLWANLISSNPPKSTLHVGRR